MSASSPMYLYFSLLFSVLTFHCPVLSEYEGSKCKNSHSTGICTLVTDCPVASEALKLRRTHDLHRCGFEGFTEIVCCPSNSQMKEPDIITTTTTTTEASVTQSRGLARKCAQACEEYSNEIKPKLSYNIIDGEDANIKEFPHMAALGYKQEDGSIDWKCGATLISSRYLITAAHCIVTIDGILPTKARMGVVDITLRDQVAPQDFDVINTTVNRKYSYRDRHHDIALVKIDRDVISNDYVYPACLYTADDDPLGLIVTGWGYTAPDGSKKSNKLQKARLSPYPQKECNNVYKTRISKTIIESQICAIDNTSDTCGGDSGGPLQIQNKKGTSVYSLVGITSYGINCGGKSPGIYTRVSKYLDWVEEVVWPQ